jgi:hypothetical protein
MALFTHTVPPIYPARQPSHGRSAVEWGASKLAMRCNKVFTSCDTEKGRAHFPDILARIDIGGEVWKILWNRSRHSLLPERFDVQHERESRALRSSTYRHDWPNRGGTEPETNESHHACSGSAMQLCFCEEYLTDPGGPLKYSL